MNVYRREIKAHIRSLCFWALGVLFFIVASSTKYGAMAGDPAALGIFTQLPLGLQAMFGIGHLDYSKASGFYGMIYPYLLLLAAIHASMLGAVILAKEERDKTSEFLYVKPCARKQVLTAKLTAALTLVTAFFLLIWTYSVVMVRSYGENADASIANLMVGLYLVQLIFLTVGFTAAAVTRRPKAATGIAAGFMLGAYILSVAIDINGNIEWAKVFTPFSYFDAKRVIGNGEALNLWYILLSIALIAGLTAWAYLRFPKRDLRGVGRAACPSCRIRTDSVA